VEEQVVRAAAC